MSLRFVFGGSGSGKSSFIQNEFIKRAAEDRERQFIIVVPDQSTMQTQKEMVDRHPDGGIMNIDIQSFGRLCHLVADETGEAERKVLDDTGKNLVLRSLAGRLEKELPVIGGNIKKNGYIKQIKSVISEFMQYGIGPEDVDRLVSYASEKKLLAGKLKDIRKLYTAFNEYLGEHFITKEEKLDILAGNIEKSELLKGAVVAFDGFTGFTPVQNGVILAMLKHCSEVIVSVILPPSELELYLNGADDHMLFALSAKTVGSLKQLAAEAGCGRGEDALLSDSPVYRYEHQPVLSHLEQNIFRHREVFSGDPGKELQLFAASSPENELKEIFKRIWELTRHEGLAYRDIAVITGDLERYAPYVCEAENYGIPVFLDNNRKLENDPCAEFLLSALKAVSGNMRYEDVMHYLRCGFADISDEEADLLDDYLLATGIRGLNRYESVFTYRPGAFSDEESLAEVNGIREKLVQGLSPLCAYRKGGTAAEYSKACYDFLTGSSIFEKLEACAAYFREQGDAGRAREYEEVFESICRLLEQTAALLGEEKLGCDEYLEILKSGIAELKVGVLPPDTDRVVIGDMERTRLKPVKVLFFAGVNDGIIPAATGTGGMISDIDREFLEGSGYALAPTPRQKMFIQQLYLYHVLSRPSERLIISYSRMDQKADSIRPSYLISRIKELFPALKCGESSEGRMPVPGPADLAEGLSAFAAGQLADEEKIKKLLTEFYSYRSVEPVNAVKLADAAFYSYSPLRLSEKAAQGLYGKVLEGSVSRMESFASCAYAHYLSYGLKLKERAVAGFNSVDQGTVFHRVLEGFGKRLRAEGISWDEVSDEKAVALVKELLSQALEPVREGGMIEDARTAYRWGRMERILIRSVLTIRYQLAKGGFKPAHYEKHFERMIELDKGRMILSGKIDRVDILREDDRLYVKIPIINQAGMIPM